jgi:2-octaprenyl-6-methoxyphenol hydroxylase
MSEHDRYDIVIAGASYAGLACACALSDALPGARIAILDRAGFERGARSPDVRASALSAGSKRMLAALAIWDWLKEHAQPVSAIDITDSSLDDAIRPVLLSYDTRVDDGEPATYVVGNEHLIDALLRAVAARPTVTPFYDSAVGFAAAEHGVAISLAGGRALTSCLLIAADGRQSRLRHAAGIKTVGWTYPQIGIVSRVRHEKPHWGRAVQHFLPGGPFAILPLPGDQACVTWTEEEARGREILALSGSEFLAELEKRFGFRLGALALAGPRQAWPLDMHLARALIGHRFALIGDSAHGVHPIAGQGVNLGLRDVAALAEVVADAARLGLDIGFAAVLERYQRWRRLDSALSAATFDALNRLFSNDWTLLRTARDAGLGLVDRLPGLKQFFVSEAAGLTGKVPKLLRGEPV